MTIEEEKAQVRAEVLARRDGMDARQRMQKSALICRQIVGELHLHQGNGEFAEAGVVALFSALGSEADLRGAAVGAANMGLRVAMPVMLKDAPEEPSYMEFVQVTREDILTPEADFMTKPACALLRSDFDFQRWPLVAAEEIVAMAVPLVAYDGEGGRLGYGGGNYDRYLPHLVEGCWVFGAAFAEQQVETVPRNQFDLALPQVISA